MAEATIRQGERVKLSDNAIRQMLKSAVKAPSSHNTQPWLFRRYHSGLEILADRTRALPVVDPFDRELTVSCGAVIRFLELAARQYRWEADVMPVPEPFQPDLLARVSFYSGAEATDTENFLFDAIDERKTNRLPFEDEPVMPYVVEKCKKLAAGFGVELTPVTEGKTKSKVAGLVALGDQMQFDDPRFRRELAAWVHSYRLGSRDGMSGAAFGMPDVLAPAARLVIRTFDLGDGVAASDADKINDGSPLLICLSTPSDSSLDWIAAGRALADVQLYLTAHGYAASYLNQPIETQDLRPKLKEAMGGDGMLQLLLRVGRPKETVGHSARREVGDVMLPD